MYCKQSCKQPWQLDHLVLQADDFGRSVSFRAALRFPYLLRQTSLGVFWSTGQRLQPWFPVVWSSSASTVLQALQLSHNEVFPPTWLGDCFSPLGNDVCALEFLRLGTFHLGRRLEGKGDFAEYQPMISVAICTGHHSGV